MSDILVSIDSIAGESTLSGYENQIECVALRHVIDLPIVPQSTARVEGTSRHGAIEFEHFVDLATPGLRLAVSAGQNLGEVTVTRLKMVGGDLKPVEIIKLAEAYVVRVDLETQINAENGRMADEPNESFALEYGMITWETKKFVAGTEAGAITAAFSVADSKKV